jgi:phospholipid transport system substrate-binding protein
VYRDFSRTIRLTALAALTLSALSPSAMAISDLGPGIQTKQNGAIFRINGEANEAALNGAKALIGDIADRGIGFLSDTSLSEDKRKSEFRDLLNDAFDMDTIGRFALGRYWKTAKPDQKKEYQKLFNDLIVRVYTARFKEYDGQKLEVTGARKDSANDDVIVHTVIIPKTGQQKFVVEWRVRGKNNKFKVVDILVEGVSMALTQRSDFASVIQRGGGDIEVLLEHLRK